MGFQHSTREQGLINTLCTLSITRGGTTLLRSLDPASLWCTVCVKVLLPFVQLRADAGGLAEQLQALHEPFCIVPVVWLPLNVRRTPHACRCCKPC